MEFLFVNLLYTLILTLFGVISLRLNEGKAKQFFFSSFFILSFILLFFIKIYSIPSFFSFPEKQQIFIVLFVCAVIVAITSAYICIEANLDEFVFKNSIKVFAVLINLLLVFLCQMSYLPFLNDTGKLIIKAIFKFLLQN
jgi:hypothetical protein